MASRTRRGRRVHSLALAGLVLAAFAATAITPIAPIAPIAPSSAAAPTAAVDDEGAGPARMMLVLDSSGSMKERADGGETKVSAAKGALDTVISQLPDDQDVGLRVYGATVFSGDQPGACTDSQQVVPLGTGNRKALRREVAKYKPYGETPIGYALQEAGKDLGETGRRTIVLVSDGEPTCEPDPCDVARELSRQGIDLHIDVVGLDVDDAARRKLTCIADAGNGTYYDASNRTELRDSLSAVSRRAARPYTPVGRVVTGAADPASAPVITAGDWLDPTTPPAKDTYYAVERSAEGSTLIAGAAYRVAAEGGVDNLDVSLETEGGSTCSIGNGVGDQGGLASAAASVTPYTSDEDCLTASRLLLHIEYLGNPPQTPTEIRVTELHPVEDLETLPEASTSTAWIQPPATGRRTEVSGGVSFLDAEQLTPGSYRGTIVPGELLTFSVDADWGQQVAVSARYPALRGESAEVADGTTTAAGIYAPSRASAEAVFTEPSTSASDLLLKDGNTRVEATTPVINFANIEREDAASLSGAYTIVLRLDRPAGTPSIAVPFELEVDVSGTPTTGPSVVEAEPATPEPSDTAEPSEAPSPTAANPATEGTDPTQETASSPGDDDGGPSRLSLVLGGLGVAALAAAVVLGLRRARTTSS
ncbi:vWA domain-containing protein [Nocardioides sp. GXZ039]|uniref:vWA domain-containing protein n=1 Tax=Nocardioides sp. GXZ039 TaxID=3136018 RepID=UPI0030F3D26E